MCWDKRVFVDNALPFGLRSAPKIFNAVADALEWIIKARGVERVYHYLDDFITLGRPHSDACARSISSILQTCDALGVPVAVDKCEGPAVCLTFLGIEIDSIAMEIRLPAEKLQALRVTLRSWRGRKACTKRELLSLIGRLGHACKVVKPGRVFLSQMIRLSTAVNKLSHHVRLNQSFRADLGWWHAFITKWNGVSLLPKSHQSEVVVTSDASGSWGCGAFWATQWFQLQWPDNMPKLHITAKELIPIVVSAAVWGKQWSASLAKVRCDNMAVVHIINTGYSRDPEVMHFMRCLHFITAQYDIRMVAEHIQGTLNTAADALSRNSLCAFQGIIPEADPNPTLIPVMLVDTLMVTKPDWLSTNWTSLFSTI